jgi:hypothetical protein
MIWEGCAAVAAQKFLQILLISFVETFVQRLAGDSQTQRRYGLIAAGSLHGFID